MLCYSGPVFVGAGVISDSESLQVLNLLPTLLRAPAPWYRAKGWPEVDQCILATMHGQGKLLLDKLCSQTRIKTQHVFAATPAGITHVLVSDAGCGALCYTVEARHNMMVDAWCRVSAREGIYSSLDSHV